MSVRSAITGVVFTLLLLVSIAYLEFLPEKEPIAPVVRVVNICNHQLPGMRRIGDYGFQFDLPEKNLVIHEGWSDMLPGPHGYCVRLHNRNSWLNLSWYDEGRGRAGGIPEISALTYSGYSETRRIRNSEGQIIGEDTWGYWKGEHWRRVQLMGRITASYGSRNRGEVAAYGSVHEKDAAFFDWIISSACRMPDTSR